MSLAAVTELSHELRRLAIAGASLACGDHRIARLVPALAKSGEKVPVFAKIAETAKALVDSDRKTAAGALLRVNALVMAVLKTQGKSSVEGEIAPLGEASLKGNQPVSARSLEEVKAALIRGGEGRLETIQNAYERGFFGDIRLAEAAVAALADNSHEVANMAAELLVPPYGPGIAPLLVGRLDPGAKKPGARVMAALRGCHPAAAAGLARVILEGGEEFGRRFGGGAVATDEVRAAALECLTDSDADTGVLLDHLKAKKKAVRVAALRRLVEHGYPEAEELVLGKLGGSASQVREAIESLPSVRSAKILSAVEKLLATYLGDIEKTSLPEANTLVQLLTAIARSDPDAASTPIAIRGMDRYRAIVERFSKESWSAKARVVQLERQLLAFLGRSGDGGAVDSILGQLAHLENSGHAMAAMVSVAGPGALWKKAGKTFSGLRRRGIEIDSLFMGYTPFGFPDFDLPPPAEWGRAWLKFAVEQRLPAMAAYLFEVDPAAVAKGLLKGKIRELSLAALCLAAAPAKAKAIRANLDLSDERYWRDEPARLRDLLGAVAAKKGAEANHLAADLAGNLREPGVGTLLTTAIRAHFP